MMSLIGAGYIFALAGTQTMMQTRAPEDLAGPRDELLFAGVSWRSSDWEPDRGRRRGEDPGAHDGSGEQSGWCARSTTRGSATGNPLTKPVRAQSKNRC